VANEAAGLLPAARSEERDRAVNGNEKYPCHALNVARECYERVTTILAPGLPEDCRSQASAIRSRG
jgi:hypothetical protein